MVKSPVYNRISANFYVKALPVLSTANITMQFGPKPLFENISVKFGDGNRYGLIGANGCGKSTFMKILGGDLDPSAGNVSLDTNERLASCVKISLPSKKCACSTSCSWAILKCGRQWLNGMRFMPIRKPPTTTT